MSLQVYRILGQTVVFSPTDSSLSECAHPCVIAHYIWWCPLVRCILVKVSMLPTVHTAIPECVLEHKQVPHPLSLPHGPRHRILWGVYRYLSWSKHIPLSLSLSGKEIRISKKSIRQEQTAALHALRRSHAPPSQARENEYPSWVKMGRYGAENRPPKVARHFSQLIDGKLPCT